MNEEDEELEDEELEDEEDSDNDEGATLQERAKNYEARRKKRLNKKADRLEKRSKRLEASSRKNAKKRAEKLAKKAAKAREKAKKVSLFSKIVTFLCTPPVGLILALFILAIILIVGIYGFFTIMPGMFKNNISNFLAGWKMRFSREN